MEVRDFPTQNTSKWLLHYTCQSLKPEVLKKYWILAVWTAFGIWIFEVLLIPPKLIIKMWKQISNINAVNQMTCEQILRDLDAKSKKK
jgi:hypothetical protein